MKIRNDIGLLVIIGALCQSIAHADVTLYFNPQTTNTQVGQSFTVEIMAELGTGPVDDIVSAFDFDVVFDSGFLDPQGVTFGGYLGNGDDDDFVNGSIRYSDLTINVAESSWMLDDDLATSQQPGPINLVSLNFVALAETTTPTALGITFDPAFQDVKGRNYTPVTVVTQQGFVNVSEVPAPATAALMMLGLLSIGVARRWAA